MQLKIRITLYCLLTSFILFSIATLINTYFFYIEAKDFRKKEIDSLVSLYVSEIDKLTFTADKLGTDVATLGQHYYQIKSQGSFDFKEEVSSFLVEKVQNYPEIIGAGIWYEPNLISGKFFGPYAAWNKKKSEITWEYSNENYNYFNQAWYQLALPKDWNREKERTEKKYRTSPYVDDLNGIKTTFLTFTTLMYSKSKKIIGVVTVDLELNRIKELLSSFKITPNSFIVLIDKSTDKIVYHPLPEKILENYHTIEYLKDTEFSEQKNQELEININNEIYILNKTTTNSSFILITLLNKRESYSLILNIITRNIIISIVTIFLIGILIYSLVNKSIKPLEQIVPILRGVTNGVLSLNDRIDIHTSDEFGELAKSFNELISKLNSMITLIYKAKNDIKIATDKIINQSSGVVSLSASQAKSTSEISISLENISAIGDSFSQGKDEASHPIVQINKRIETISDSTMNISSIISILNNTISKTRENILYSGEELNETLIAMNEIKEITSKITEFTSIISDISDRTNLLSLNASIEAARAGESGKGFAVVASEITKLAESTLESVSNVKQTIKSIFQTVDTGSEQVIKISKRVNQMQTDISEIEGNAESISRNMKNQILETEEILKSSDELKDFSSLLNESFDKQKLGIRKIIESVINLKNNSGKLNDYSLDLNSVADKLSSESSHLEKTLNNFKTN